MFEEISGSAVNRVSLTLLKSSSVQWLILALSRMDSSSFSIEWIS